MRGRTKFGWAGFALLSLVALLLAAGPAFAAMPAPRIQVLSNRADLVSGGDALVRVTAPRKVRVPASVSSRVAGT